MSIVRTNDIAFVDELSNVADGVFVNAVLRTGKLEGRNATLKDNEEDGVGRTSSDLGVSFSRTDTVAGEGHYRGHKPPTLVRMFPTN